MDPEIQSIKNPLVRRFRAAALGDAPGLMLAEGRRLAQEALGAGCTVVEAAWSPRLLSAQDGQQVLDSLADLGCQVHACTDKVLDRVSQLSTHQGISLVLRRPAHQLSDLLGAGRVAPLLVVVDGVRDPGNLGALVRSAEAAGATGMLVVAGSADPFRDKALRGSAGSVFRLPVLAGMEASACVESLRSAGVGVLVAADVDSAVPCWDVDLSGPTALVVGAEGCGVSDAFLASSDARVVVPHADAVESLNVAVAAGVLLFEARRQRR